jgi:hypothetical protein
MKHGDSTIVVSITLWVIVGQRGDKEGVRNQ